VYVKDFDSEDSDLIGADGEGSGVPTTATKEASLTGKITVSCYVDDPVIVCDTEAAEQWYHNEMEKRFDVKHHSYLTVATPLEYCGTRLSLTVDNELKVDNKRFIEKMLDERGLQDANSVQSPLTKTTLSHLFANKDKLLDAAEGTCFRSGLGQVHWLAATTHAKLAPAHSMLAKYTANPCEGCLEALKTCIRYAAGVKEECLVMPADITEGLKVYTDSDWAGSYSVDQDTHSRTGVLVTYNGVPVDWMSAKQLCIATSSGDAESRALASGVQRGLQIQYIAEELMIATPSVLHIWVDAEAAIGFARNNGGGTKMKHLDIRMQWVQEIRDKKKIKIHKVAGPHNRSDFFTKLMTKSEFKRTSEGLCGKL
jgi:phosphotransferase system IIB component